jgi:hypothetical protein
MLAAGTPKLLAALGSASYLCCNAASGARSMGLVGAAPAAAALQRSGCATSSTSGGGSSSTVCGSSRSISSGGGAAGDEGVPSTSSVAADGSAMQALAQLVRRGHPFGARAGACGCASCAAGAVAAGAVARRRVL